MRAFKYNMKSAVVQKNTADIPFGERAVDEEIVSLKKGRMQDRGMVENIRRIVSTSRDDIYIGVLDDRGQIQDAVRVSWNNGKIAIDGVYNNFQNTVALQGDDLDLMVGDYTDYGYKVTYSPSNQDELAAWYRTMKKIEASVL